MLKIGNPNKLKSVWTNKAKGYELNSQKIEKTKIRYILLIEKYAANSMI